MFIQTEREVRTISPTSLSAWLRCRADWYNRYITKADRSGTWNTMVGNAVHLATYLYHTGQDWRAGLREFWEEHSDILSETEGCPSLVTVETLLVIYIQMNPRHIGDVGEKYFKVEVEGLPKPLTGIFDLLPGARPSIAEFKTGGWWTQARADLAMQTIHYTLAYRELYGRMPEDFTYLAFDLENVRVRKIRTGVSEAEVQEFIPYAAAIYEEQRRGIVLPRCLFKDNNQTCWYPEECARIMEELHETSRNVMPSRRGNVISEPSSKSRPKRGKGEEVREDIEDKQR